MTATYVRSEIPVGIYCRISDDPEARQVGVDRQAQACRRLASQRGWATVELYIDNDISAFTGVSRPAYRRMLDDVRLGRLAAIVTWDADRLHRSTRELEDFIDLIEATSTTVVTVTAGTSDFATASGRMQARIKGTVARYESEHKTERVTAAHASLAEAGRWKGGPRPYGYDVGRDNIGRPLNDGRLIVIDYEATVIREAAAAILAGGTVYGVCRDSMPETSPPHKARVGVHKPCDASSPTPLWSADASIAGRSLARPCGRPSSTTRTGKRYVSGLAPTPTGPRRQPNFVGVICSPAASRSAASVAPACTPTAAPPASAPTTARADRTRTAAAE
jgi:DNA invertase Pin-like site-specific DNA recombinase